MPRLTSQTHAEWAPIRRPWCIGSLDLDAAPLAELTGWTWDEVEEEGLGPTAYMYLAWDGRSRYCLTASGSYPADGIAVEVDAGEDPAGARADLVAALGLSTEDWLAIAEGDTWFARWDPPHNAGDRPATARPRT